MKKLTLIFSGLFLTALVSCDSGDKRTERTVLDKDTVSAETEYKVEKQVKEKTVDVDTVTETETITREREMEDTTESGS